MTRQGDRGEDAEHDGADARERSDDRAGLERASQVAVLEERAVPAEREARERERGHRRVVEREDQQDHDRRVEEHHDEAEERAQDAGAVLRERDVHQSAATWLGCRKRANTTVSTETTISRKIASTEPVSQSGKPVPNRSTIWFPYM